jgi:hypothetical protein
MFSTVVIQMATEPTDVDVDVLEISRNDKRERKKTAQTLPPGITQTMMKKYVVYYREMTYLKNGKSQPREYFKVESHPKLPKPWVSSKSIKIPLLEKLNDANQVVAGLENTADPVEAEDQDQDQDQDQDPIHRIHQKWIKYLPKYTRLRVNRPKKDNSTIISLVYDRKDTSNGFRWTAVYTFMYNQPMSDGVADTDPDPDPDPDDKTAISLGLQHLRNKLREKYGADVLGL